MNLRIDKATEVSLLFAALAALGIGLLLVRMTLPLALGVGLGLVVLVIAIASDELALYLLIFSMLLGPELVVGGLGEGATLGRGLTFRLDDVLIVIIGFTWVAKTAPYKELGLFLRTPLNRPIAAYTVSAIFATGLGILAGRVGGLTGSLFVLKYIEYFVVYFMVVNNLRERKQFERFLLVLLATAAVASLIGILQIPSGARVSAPFEGATGEPNSFGGYLVLMLALVAGLYLTSESFGRKCQLASLGVVIAIPLLFTLSRTSYLALIPVAGALLVFSQRKLLMAFLLAFGLALAPFVLPTAVTNRVMFTVTQPLHPSQTRVGNVRLDTSTSARLRSWKEAVSDFPEHPVFGYGVTGYRFLDAQYPRVLLETGAVGLLAFLFLQLSLFREARDVLRRTQDPLFKGVALGFLVGFIGMVVHGLGANTFTIVRIMEPFWFLTAMVMMIPQLEQSSTPTAVNTRARRAMEVKR